MANLKVLENNFCGPNSMRWRRLQPVPWKMRLEMVIGMKNEILIGIIRYLIESKELELELESKFWNYFVCPTQSIMNVPLQVNTFQKIILLIVQYKYVTSCSKDFILQNLILRTRLCGTGFNTQPSLAFDFPHEKLLGIMRVSHPATRKDLSDRTWGSSGINPK